MILYVAKRGFAYEGFNILGIFTTKKKAESIIEKDKLGNFPGDYYEVEKYKLDKEVV